MLFKKPVDHGQQIESCRQLLKRGTEAFEQDRLDVAETNALEAIQIADHIGGAGDDLRCSAKSSLSMVYCKRGEFEKAQAALDVATQIVVTNRWQYSIRHFYVLINTAVLRWGQRDRESALSVLLHAYEELVPRAKTPEHHFLVRKTLENLCAYYLQIGAVSEARKWVGIAKDRLARQKKPHAEALASLFFQEVQLWQQSDGGVANFGMLRAEATRIEQLIGSEHEKMLLVQVALASALTQCGRDEEAETIFQKVRARMSEASGRTAKRLLANGLGMIELRRKNYVKAEQFFHEELSVTEDLSVGSNAVALNNVGVSMREQGRLAEAEKILKKAIEAGDLAFGPNQFHPANAMKNLGQTYYRLGLFAEAIQSYEAAIERFGKVQQTSGAVLAKKAETVELLARARAGEA